MKNDDFEEKMKNFGKKLSLTNLFLTLQEQMTKQVVLTTASDGHRPSQSKRLLFHYEMSPIHIWAIKCCTLFPIFEYKIETKSNKTEKKPIYLIEYLNVLATRKKAYWKFLSHIETLEIFTMCILWFIFCSVSV